VTLRIFLLIVMALFALRAIGRLMGGITQAARGGDMPRGPSAETPVKMMKDPICGTFVVPGKALSASAGGATVWFCSEQCRDAFTRRG
jgi:YHS domain-containing protein